jgi:hypothetical protein
MNALQRDTLEAMNETLILTALDGREVLAVLSLEATEHDPVRADVQASFSCGSVVPGQAAAKVERQLGSWGVADLPGLLSPLGGFSLPFDDSQLHLREGDVSRIFVVADQLLGEAKLEKTVTAPLATGSRARPSALSGGAA